MSIVSEANDGVKCVEFTEVIKIDEGKALYWLTKGAQVSDTVRQLFRKSGVIKKFNEARNAPAE